MLTTLSYNDQIVNLTPGKMTFFDELYVDYKMEQKYNFTRLQLTIHPKQKITLKNLKITQNRPYESHERVFCNGFQSWSESREYDLNERIPQLRSLARPYLKYYGDTYMDHFRSAKGQFHSWTYGYIRNRNKIEFMGSLNERTAFSLIQYDTKARTISFEKDCEGLVLEHSFPILDLFIAKGKEAAIFEEYFQTMGIPKPTAPPLSGWTSWYNYYTNISEEIISKNTEAFAEKNAQIDIIQIDDGYQKAVGDWLDIKDTFPSGMAKVARDIKNKGFKAGLWLAPFVCSQASEIFRTKQHWLLKDEKGQLIKAGYNPLWGGWFYALNFYQKEVQDYLLKVFKIVLEKWNYDLVKLDFLFAACLQPPAHKTRGQMMHESLDFLRRTVGKKWILGCGVPLGSAFGLVDYCRVGADIHLKWEHHLLKFLGNRERVSTILALRTVLGRWQLNARAFQNDPDVILLRDQNIHLSSVQQFTILIINTLLGNLLFTSDDISEYTPEQWAEFQNIYKWRNSEVREVEQIKKDLYRIRFRKDTINWECLCNLTKRPQVLMTGKKQVQLEPFESMILKDRN